MESLFSSINILSPEFRTFFMKKSNIFCLQNLLVWVKQLDFFNPKNAQNCLPFVYLEEVNYRTIYQTFWKMFLSATFSCWWNIWKPTFGKEIQLSFLLVHGWESNARSRWEKLLPYFAKNRKYHRSSTVRQVTRLVEIEFNVIKGRLHWYCKIQTFPF
jgi:hypothetical protein